MVVVFLSFFPASYSLLSSHKQIGLKNLTDEAFEQESRKTPGGTFGAAATPWVDVVSFCVTITDI